MNYLMITLSLLVVSPLWASLRPSDKELVSLKSGKLIVRAKKIKGESWRRWTIYTLIDTTPQNSVAVLSDYPNQKLYISGLKVAKIVKERKKNSHDVSFILDMPWPINDARYTTNNVVEQTGKTYQVKWFLVKSNSAKKSNGKAVFHPFEGKTLFEYQSFISPKTVVAGLLRGKALHDLKKTVVAIKKGVERIVEKDPRLLMRQLKLLDKRLK